jgi:hypothetical protein
MLRDVVVSDAHERHHAKEFWISVLAVFGLLVYLISKYAFSVAAPNTRQASSPAHWTGDHCWHFPSPL